MNGSVEVRVEPTGNHCDDNEVGIRRRFFIAFQTINRFNCLQLRRDKKAVFDYSLRMTNELIVKHFN